jgi:hypothetical protein
MNRFEVISFFAQNCNEFAPKTKKGKKRESLSFKIFLDLEDNIYLLNIRLLHAEMKLKHII